MPSVSFQGLSLFEGSKQAVVGNMIFVCLSHDGIALSC